MRLRERVLTTILLMTLIIGGNGVLSQYLNHCCEPSHTEHHTCCHCKSHAAECDYHRLAIDHDCLSKYDRSLTYTNNDRRGSYRSLNTCAISYNHLVSEEVSYNIAPIVSEEIPIVPWLRLRAISQFCPSTNSLRAPPALV